MYTVHSRTAGPSRRSGCALLLIYIRLDVLRVKTRVGDLATGLDDADLLGNTRSVLEESNVGILLDEEALAPAAPEGLVHVLVGVLVVRAEELLEGLGGLGAVVVGDTRGSVVGNVRAADLVPEDTLHPAHLTVDGGKSATSEGPGLGRVVGKDRVRV